MRSRKNGSFSTILTALVALIAPETGETQGLTERVKILETRVDALERRISDLEQALQPMILPVNCASGGSVAGALAGVQFRPGAVHIVMAGVCREEVAITRDDVTLRGNQPSDGLEAPTPASTVLSVVQANRVRLVGFTITGGGRGLSVRGGSVTATALQVQGTTVFGIDLLENALAALSNVTAQNNGVSGISVVGSSYARVDSSRLSNSRHGLVSGEGATVLLRNSTVEDNSQPGVFAQTGSVMSISGGTVRRNGAAGLPGISVHHNSTLILSSGAVVEDNPHDGISLFRGVLVAGGATVANNGSDGIRAFGSSFVHLGGGNVIRSNLGNGVRLLETTMAAADLPLEISSNTGWGVLCDPQAGGAHVIGAFGGAAIFANGAGQVSCPEVMIP